MMVPMTEKSRKLTTIGLIFEGLNQAFLYGVIHLMIFATNLTYPIYYQVFTGNTSALNDPANNIGETEGFIAMFIFILIILIIISLPLFLFHLVLFTKHMKGKFTSRGAKHVYHYQMVIGIAMLIITAGISIMPSAMYIISGYHGLEALKKGNMPVWKK